MSEESTQNIFDSIYSKSKLKQKVYRNTLETFGILKKSLNDLSNKYARHINENNLDTDIGFEVKDRGKFEIEVRFGGDILLFMMHTNIFEFPRNHSVMNTSYIREDKSRSYCGIIYIYNFLADSFKYHRPNDLGYLIGRVFVNNENHYFVEGKRELGFIYNNFGQHEINHDSITEILAASINYTINFDLLCPPYENQKLISVDQIKNTLDTISLKTGKRIGFQFQEDIDEEDR